MDQKANMQSLTSVQENIVSKSEYILIRISNFKTTLFH